MSEMQMQPSAAASAVKPSVNSSSRSSQGSFRLYRELSKSGIVTLVLISVFGGYLAGQPFESPLSWSRLGLTLLGVLLLASGSSALNQIQERHIDAQMPRTASRPLPSGRMTLQHAVIFTAVCLIGGLIVLGSLGPALLIMGLLAVASYNFLYTLWWKRKMAYAAVPGAIPGALPILMGYAAASGEVFHPGGIYLFFILFFWQMPHFWVLALRFEKDYAQGGFPTLPVIAGSGITVKQITLWCLAYVALALGAPIFFRVGSVYLSLTVLLSAKVLWELRRFALAPESERQEKWLRFFLWVNFSLIGYVGGLVVDLWSIHLIRHIKG